MISRLHGRLVSLAALVALIVIVIGVPALLIAVGGWPLPSTLPDWSSLTRAISQGEMPATTVVKALAVIVWFIWIQVVWALFWEIAVNLPRLNRGYQPRKAPLVAAPVGSGVGRLVALALAVGITITSTPAHAIALPTPTPVTAPAIAAPAPEATHRVARPTAPRALPTWTVEQHDSLWRIAEATLGDGQRFTEILELNPWLPSARDLTSGQVLSLPQTAQIPTDRTKPGTPLPEAAAPTQAAVSASAEQREGYVPLAQVMIQPGDTLWDLTEDRLKFIDDEVTPAETVEHLDDVIAANPDIVENPNLIYPGEVFTFPALGTAPPPPAESVPPASEPPNPTPTPPISATVPAATVAADTATAPTSSTIPSTPANPAAAARATDDRPSATRTAVFEAHSRPGSVAPWLAGISGATTLATGLLLLYRRRLALRAARGTRAYRAAVPHDPTTLTALTRAADVSLIRWANQQLAELFARLQPGDVDGQPFAVELSETHGIEILWTSPNADPPAPWSADATGWSWRLAFDPDWPCTSSDSPAALPALVTIGTRDGNQLLLNLEATGTLDIIGEHQDSAEDFIRSLIVELAAGELLTDTYIINAGVRLDGLAQLDRVHTCDSELAVDRARTAAAGAAEFLHAHQLASAFEARLGGDAIGREATVLAVRTGADLPEIQPGIGVCSVNIATGPAAPNSIAIDADGIATLQPSGLRFHAAALPLATVETISDLIDEASEPYDPEVSIADESVESDLVAELDFDAIPIVGPVEVDDNWTLPTPKVMVRVLGEPEVLGADLGRIETSIVTYIASHDNSRRDDQVINAVWNGRAVEPKTLWNKISKIRTALGTDSVPARPPKTNEITFSDHVTTDLVILQHAVRRADRVSQAEALDLLMHGLGLIAGIPFDGSSCDWAYETQDHAIACEAVETAALAAVKIALELGDIAAARAAVSQGLRALPLNEPLYRARMRVEAASGSPQRVGQALSELRAALELHCDDGLAIEPEAETEQLARRLCQGGLTADSGTSHSLGA